MPSQKFDQTVDLDSLKAQVDAEILARLQVEAEAAHHIYRRGFHIGEMKLLVSLDATSEVTEIPPLFRLPGAPIGVIGLVNSHGRVLPVADLSVLFGIQHQRSASAWLLTCGRGDDAVGLIIDSLPERKKFVRDDEVNLVEVTLPIAAYARGAYRDGQDIWVDVDFVKFFTAVLQVDLTAV
ncbi:MAG: chemotaxis protein CheW [Gallionella sp.]|jgi:purine-binding chemotaxis protein CheW